jgi:hypothetical protein
LVQYDFFVEFDDARKFVVGDRLRIVVLDSSIVAFDNSIVVLDNSIVVLYCHN